MGDNSPVIVEKSDGDIEDVSSSADMSQVTEDGRAFLDH